MKMTHRQPEAGTSISISQLSWLPGCSWLLCFGPKAASPHGAETAKTSSRSRAVSLETAWPQRCPTGARCPAELLALNDISSFAAPQPGKSCRRASDGHRLPGWTQGRSVPAEGFVGAESVTRPLPQQVSVRGRQRGAEQAWRCVAERGMFEEPQEFWLGLDVTEGRGVGRE